MITFYLRSVNGLLAEQVFFPTTSGKGSFNVLQVYNPALTKADVTQMISDIELVSHTG